MKIKEGYVLRNVAGEYIVMNIGGDTSLNHMITLNETGALIWNGIADGKSESDIAELIVSQYEVDTETAASDIKKFIDKMNGAGVLE